MKKFLLASGGVIAGLTGVYAYAYNQSFKEVYAGSHLSDIAGPPEDPSVNKKIVIIGAGIIGLTSAYYLQKLGKDVTVLEERNGPGLKTSFKNGCIVTPGLYTRPW